jgi:hypothetical protein
MVDPRLHYSITLALSSPSPYRSRLGIENKERHHAERADDAHRRRGPGRADRRRQGADERAAKKQ